MLPKKLPLLRLKLLLRPKLLKRQPLLRLKLLRKMVKNKKLLRMVNQQLPQEKRKLLPKHRKRN